MAIKKVSRAYQPQSQQISSSRVAKSAFITVLTLVLLFGFVWHFWWAVKVYMSNYYGNWINSVVLGFGSVIANAGISLRLLTYLNEKLIDEGIDADHRKYI